PRGRLRAQHGRQVRRAGADVERLAGHLAGLLRHRPGHADRLRRVGHRAHAGHDARRRRDLQRRPRPFHDRGLMTRIETARRPRRRAVALALGVALAYPATAAAATNNFCPGAGPGAPFEFPGDGGRATAAGLSFPEGVAPAADGGFLIADTSDARVRRVSADGTIATV